MNGLTSDNRLKEDEHPALLLVSQLHKLLKKLNLNSLKIQISLNKLLLQVV